MSEMQHSYGSNRMNLYLTQASNSCFYYIYMFTCKTSYKTLYKRIILFIFIRLFINSNKILSYFISNNVSIKKSVYRRFIKYLSDGGKK